MSERNMPKRIEETMEQVNEIPAVREKIESIEFKIRVSAAIATGDVLTPFALMETAEILRDLVRKNGHRFPKKLRQIADRLGQVETLAQEEIVLKAVADEKQEKLPLDKPDSIDSELDQTGHRRRKAS